MRVLRTWQFVDGWNADVELDSGERQEFHFAKAAPSEADVLATAQAWLKAQAAAMESAYWVECENGKIV